MSFENLWTPDGVPIPFNEEIGEDYTRTKDYTDYLLPKTKGFITDFVYHTRGYETPTNICVWTALGIMSSAIKREAYSKWVPRPLFTNLYLILVGPAGIVKKTTAAWVALDILRGVKKFINKKVVRSLKNYKIIQGKTSPEGLIDSMLPDPQAELDAYVTDDNGAFVVDASGNPVKIPSTSEATLIISELSTLLSKSTYASTMTEILLDVYDCHDEWHWKALNRGKAPLVLRFLHTNILAGTTLDGLRESIPGAAKGDGFLSRTILIYAPTTRREYPEPFYAKGAPTESELQRRLAWLAETSLGEYVLSDMAQKLYNSWYHDYKTMLKTNPTLCGVLSRLPVHIRKVALLMRLQRYDISDNIISEDDLKSAILLVESTYKNINFLISQLDGDEFENVLGRISDYLSRRKRMTRKDMLSRLRIKGEILTMVIRELNQRGLVKIEFNGETYDYPVEKAAEMYVWTGDIDDDE